MFLVIVYTKTLLRNKTMLQGLRISYKVIEPTTCFVFEALKIKIDFVSLSSSIRSSLLLNILY